MFSSSSADTVGARASIAALLEEALDALRVGCPRAHAEMALRLGGETVRLTVDDETFDVRVEREAVRVLTCDGRPTVSVRTSRAAVRDVLAGRRPLADALRADEVRARGRLTDLVSVLGALEAFVQGSVRCGTVARLHYEFQSEEGTT